MKLETKKDVLIANIINLQSFLVSEYSQLHEISLRSLPMSGLWQLHNDLIKQLDDVLE